MTDLDQNSARREALERVVEKVVSWQETATEGTVHEELDRGLAEAGITLTDAQRDDLARRISDGDRSTSTPSRPTPRAADRPRCTDRRGGQPGDGC